MTTLNIEGKRREATGKQASAALRNEGRVPCVLYGGDHTVAFSVEYNDLNPLVYTPEFKKVILSVDGVEYEAIMKDIDFHPVTDRIQHIDFQQLVPGRMVKVQIPVRTEGTPPGVIEGGKLEVNMRKLWIRSLAEKLIDHLTVDVSHLVQGKSVKVGEVEVPEGIEILNNASNPIAQVVTPRAMRSADTLAAMEGEAEEGADDAEEGDGEEAEGGED